MEPASLVGPFDLVVFGGSGDLALRKLMSALYHRHNDGQITADSRIIAIGRKPLDRAGYRAQVKAHVAAAGGLVEASLWDGFAARLDYLVMDAADLAQFEPLARLLAAAPDRIRVFYMATSPDLFGPISRHLGAASLASPNSRVVLEKPLGHDLLSSRSINDAVGSVFREDQVYRIDHYLGKETVQNLMALRFGNSLFEPIWHASGVDHVQITVSETLGVEGRGGYYNKSGALRDMVQNHMLQLLCLVAMEPPAHFDADSIRDEKLKVLRSLVPMNEERVAAQVVRGQYRAGAIIDRAVPAYQEEADIQPGSATETFVALKAEIANWRWGGVPFYLRTGKRLPVRSSEIMVQLRPVPHRLFPAASGAMQPNRLLIRLQPDEGIRLHLVTKIPGPGGMRLRSVPLNLSFADTFKMRQPDAYERLLMDVVRGNATLFMRRDEVEAAWSWIGPILDCWERAADLPRPYPAGTWGPTAAIALIERDGRTWHEEGA